MPRYFLVFLFLLSCGKSGTPKEEVLKKEHVAYIVSSAGKKIDVLDLNSRKITETYSLHVPADRFPHHINLSSDGRKLAIAIPAYDFSQGHQGLHGVEKPGGVKVLDADSGRELNSFDVPFANYNAVFSADGNEIWTGAFSHSGRAFVYSSDGVLKEEILLDPDPGEIHITTDGKMAAVASGESTFLQLIDTRSKQLVRKIKVDLAPSNAWPGYDDIVLVSNELKRSVNFVNLSGFTVEDFIDLEFAPGFLIYHTDLKELWICNGAEGKVHIFKRDLIWKEQAVLNFAGEEPYMLKFFNSGREAVLITRKGSRAYFIETQSKEILSTVNTSPKPGGLAIKE